MVTLTHTVHTLIILSHDQTSYEPSLFAFNVLNVIYLKPIFESKNYIIFIILDLITY